MNNDKYKTLLDKYFVADTTKEEEEVLKKASGNNEKEKLFFEVLKEEKQAQMNWSFEDLMKETEQQLGNHSETYFLKSEKRNSWVWIAASMIFIISFGVLLMKNPLMTEAHPSAATSIPPTETKIEEDSTKPEIKLAKETEPHRDLPKETPKSIETKQNEPLAIAPKIETKENHTVDRPAAKPEEEYESSFVIINGKKIENEETAISLTENAFKLFASNVSSSINQAEVLQNLHMEF